MTIDRMDKAFFIILEGLNTEVNLKIFSNMAKATKSSQMETLIQVSTHVVNHMVTENMYGPTATATMASFLTAQDQGRGYSNENQDKYMKAVSKMI